MELLADNELHPSFPQDAFNIVKQQTAQLSGGRLESPQYKASHAMLSALLPAGDPELREATPKTVANVTLQDVNTFYAKTFRPDLTTIVVIGDITPEEAKAQVEKYFGAWKSSGPKPDVVLPPVKLNQQAAVHVPDPESVQDSVALAEMVGINRFSSDYYALQAGNHVLGGGFYATRLYHDLRQVTGLVYNVNVSLSATETRANYMVTYGCDPKNVSNARSIVIRDLTTMQKENVSPGELQQAKALLIRQIPLSEASEEAVGAGLLGRALIGLPLDEPLVAAKRYRDMTADEIRAAFAKWIRVNDFAEVVRGPLTQ
jgi:zinc protease